MEHTGIENLEHYISSHGLDVDADNLKEIISQISREKGVQIGKYKITCGGYAKQEDTIEIIGSNGNGMDCKKKLLEPVIEKFYKDNF